MKEVTAFALAVLVLALSLEAAASTLVAAEYEDFLNPVAVNSSEFPLTNRVLTVTAGPVTLTPLNPGVVRGSYGGNPLFVTDPFPKDNAGYISYNGGNIPSQDRDSVTLTFSQPVTGFGATFRHAVILFRDQPTGVAQPSTIRLFDGVEGTGNLLGEVQSSGLSDGENTTFDFVGLLSNQRNIRSAQISGPGPLFGFSVDAYVVTLAPVPEPSSLALLGLGGLGLLRRR